MQSKCDEAGDSLQQVHDEFEHFRDWSGAAQCRLILDARRAFNLILA
jgi:hypothetical protein